jgi:hypothetical protein
VLFMLLCMLALRLTNPNTLQVVPTVPDPERRKPPTLRLSAEAQSKSWTEPKLPHTRLSKAFVTPFVLRSLSVTGDLLRQANDTTQEVIDVTSNVQWKVDPVSLVFRGLSYSVPAPHGNKKTLLSNISGYALPGTMTALMGVTGACCHSRAVFGESSVLEPIAKLTFAVQVRAKPPFWTLLLEERQPEPCPGMCSSTASRRKMKGSEG